jgi:divalent metal cation (Fe/Co/Zn/Cd) transporter
MSSVIGALQVATCIVVLVMFGLNITLLGYLCSECLSCDKKEHVRTLAYWLAGVVVAAFIVMLLLTVFDAGNDRSMGCRVVLVVIVVMAIVVVQDVVKSIGLLSCDGETTQVPPAGDDGYMPFKKAKGVCITTIVLVTIVIIVTIFLLARKLVQKRQSWLQSANASQERADVYGKYEANIGSDARTSSDA